MTAPLELDALPDAQAAALLFAADPHGFGGLVLRGPAGPQRQRILTALRNLLPAGAPWRTLPAGTAAERLDDTLDLAATLAAGRPVRQRGLLAESDGGVIVLPMAERLPAAAAARLGAALDTGQAADGASARFGLVALDEGIEDEAVTAKLADRLAFHVALDRADEDEAWQAGIGAGDLAEAHRQASAVTLDDDIRRALVATAVAFGIDSLRAPLAALKAARLAAALAGRADVTADDAGLAARLILAPRATRVPAAPEQAAGQPEERSAERDGEASDAEQQAQTGTGPDEVVREAVRAALPAGLLLALTAGGRTARQTPGRAGAMQITTKRGRPAGVRRGVPSGGARLDLIETLRAAAPWQALRRPATAEGARRVQIRRDDLRLTRFKQRTETVTLFAVDASGSLALQRLAEAKGAVELLLAECYIRRDQVALLAFRGTGAELLLPPTRSLARAKRCLAGLAGGGATPLATALDAAIGLAEGIRRRGRTPVVVLLTDGRANVTRDGAVDRARAEAEAQEAARAAAATGLRMLLIDAAPRPQPAARALATAMNATYLPLPRAEAAGLTRAIRHATAG